MKPSKLKFNEWGWIVCYRFHADGFIQRMRFDTKSAAISFVNEDQEMRGVCAECLKG